MVWKKISSLFHRIPGDFYELQGQIQTRLSSRLQKQLPEWLLAQSRLEPGGTITVNHLVDYLLQREPPQVVQAISLGPDESPPAKSGLDKYCISENLQSLLREVLNEAKSRQPNFIEDDEILALAFQKASERENLTLGSGVVPDAGRLAASYFKARALRWLDPDSGLRWLFSLPARPELVSALNVESLEVWLLMHRSILTSQACLETWQSDLEEAKKLLEASLATKPADSRQSLRYLLLARVACWQNQYQQGQKHFAEFCQLDNPETIRTEQERWALIASTNPSQEQLADLWAIETWREKMLGLAGDYDEEAIDSYRGEKLWELVQQVRRQTENLCLIATEKHPDFAAAWAIRAEMYGLTEELGVVDGAFRKTKALECFDQAIEKAPDHASLFAQRARFKLADPESGQLIDPATDLAKSAFDDLEVAWRANSSHAGLTAARLAFDRAAALSNRHEIDRWLDKSLEIFERLLQRTSEPFDFDVIRGACHAYLAANQQDRALEVVEQAAQTQPKDLPLMIFAGHLCLDLAKPDKARAFLDQAFNLDPENPDALLLAARSRFDKSSNERKSSADPEIVPKSNGPKT